MAVQHQHVQAHEETFVTTVHCSSSSISDNAALKCFNHRMLYQPMAKMKCRLVTAQALSSMCSETLYTGVWGRICDCVCVGAGMTNGNIFTKVMANSPGGVIAERVQGKPPIFMSAGLQDDIFPINQAGNPVRSLPHHSCATPNRKAGKNFLPATPSAPAKAFITIPAGFTVFMS